VWSHNLWRLPGPKHSTSAELGICVMLAVSRLPLRAQAKASASDEVSTGKSAYCRRTHRRLLGSPASTPVSMFYDESGVGSVVATDLPNCVSLFDPLKGRP
jgi:hypothetical protein